MSVAVPARVAIVSDHAIYLRGLTSMVMMMPDVDLVGEGRSVIEALELCYVASPSVVVLDLKGDLAERCRIASQIHTYFPSIRIILLLGVSEQPPDKDILDAQIAYYCYRDISEEEFKSAIRHAQSSYELIEKQADSQRVFRHQDDVTVEESGASQQSSPLPALLRSEGALGLELAMAGRIQKDILPREAPPIPGWDIAARLVSARETSGDYYDFIPLTEHKWGFLVADVTDKGIGAALVMALSSTLMRTYAGRFPTLPALALSEVSQRILSDTRSGMFVTMFYGVLETHTGRVLYTNAGHPAGYLVGKRRGEEAIRELKQTGMALGISEQAQWKQKITKLEIGDYLVLYTDGLIESQNAGGVFFGEDRLLEVVCTNLGVSAGKMQQALVDEWRRFIGHAPQHDDIALVIIRREE